MEKLSLFSGNANRALTSAICQQLGLHDGEAEVFQFSNENIFVKINENIRGHDVFIVQPFSAPVNTSILELLIMIDACKRASARRITAVIPYYAYGRSDKKDQPRVPITARLIADCISVAGAHRVLTMDLHAGQIQGFFNIPVDELSAMHILARHWISKRIPNLTVVATDAGFAKKARNFAELLDAPLAIVEKRRRSNDEGAEAMGIIGQVQGRNVLIVDDEINTASSIVRAIQLVKKEGAGDVYASAVHGVLSGPAIQRLREGEFTEIVLTDTIPVPAEKRLPQMTILSVAKLFAAAIQHIHEDTSVSELFRWERY
ncbi:MAG TPA: ribose-phosphate pyrophosphokinase [Ktedonobacterales bacterium]|jgi:ribose-phosphate pyrophosphokinase